MAEEGRREMDKAEPQKSQDMTVKQYESWREQWLLFVAHPGMGSKK
jgi:hypothetical protein